MRFWFACLPSGAPLAGVPLAGALLALALLAGPAAAQPPVPAAADPGLLCRAAVATAEREASLPPRLLTAIARVESGRRDPATGAVSPWPWTINAEGRGSLFPTREAAIAAVRQLQAQGVRSIDVGCMQINLRHHPAAFASLEEAFDPLANARYAARFLTELQATRNDWMRSASHYHSQTPELADAYRARVVAAMAAEPGGPAPALQAGMQAAMQANARANAQASAQAGRPSAAPAAAPPVPAFAPGAGGGFLLSNRAEQAAMLPTPVGAGPGRGLDAYRMLPIPLAGRGPVPGMARRL